MNISQLCGDSLLDNTAHPLLSHLPEIEDHSHVNRLNANRHLMNDQHPYGHISPIQKSHSLLKHIIHQCININKEIARYRIDPLTETERVAIVDQVYYTTQSMLKSLKSIEEFQQVMFEDLEPTKNETIIKNINQTNHSTTTTTTNINTPTTTNTTTTIITTTTPVSSDYELIRQARNIQDNTGTKYKRRNRRSVAGHRCHSCQTTETPEWRRGPDGGRTLCNACGLHYSKLIRKGSLTVQTHSYLLDSPGMNHAGQVIQFSSASTTHSTSKSILDRAMSKINNSNTHHHINLDNFQHY
ncbi:GATA zinc finger-domain-containing protein [Pilobolus umbonatus]|nr:GATA zinc finger-domain-containing protein [Pilobolus umbonatus]